MGNNSLFSFLKEPSRYIGVDIHSNKMILSEVKKRRTETWELLQFIEEDISSFTKNGIQNAMKKILAQNTFSTKNMVISVDRRNFFIRQMDVPNVEEKLLHSVMQYEIVSQIPYTEGTYYYDFAKLKNNKANENKAVVVASPKEIVDGFFEAFSELGFKPLAIETPAIALSRMIKENETCAIIDINEGVMFATLFEKEDVIFSRTAVLDNEESIWREVLSTINYCKKQLPELEKIYYTSGQRFFSNLEIEGVQIEKHDIFKNITTSIDRTLLQNKNLSVSIGLALRGIEK